MKRTLQPQSGALYGALVTIFFLAIVAVWLPSLKGSLTGIMSGVGAGGEDLSARFSNQWREAESAMKILLPKKEEGATARTDAAAENGASEQLFETFASALASGTGAPSAETLAVPSVVPLQPYDVAARKYCTRQGGVYEGPITERPYGVCLFSNGSQCEAVMFEYGKCHIGQYSKAEVGIPNKADLVILKEEDGTVSVKNRGTAASSEAMLAVGTAQYPIPPLAPQASSVVAFKVPANGTLAADPTDRIPEIIEDNNSLQL